MLRAFRYDGNVVAPQNTVTEKEEIMTIWEIAVFDIRLGMEDAFEEQVRASVPIFQAAEGCRSFEVHRSLEVPGRFALHIEWDSVEHHTVIFTKTEGFDVFVASVSPYFASDPVVDHTERILVAF